MREINDTRAMDLIQSVLSGNDWTADSLDEIAEVVALTGRDTEDYVESDEEVTI